MYAWTFLAATAIIAIAAYLLLSGFLKTFRLYRGVRVITCPENLQPASVRVAAFDAAKWFAFSGETDPHLRTCSRWPEMAGCDEACLAQIQSAPHACLVNTMVTSWYAEKHCHYCGKAIGEIVWHERPPAVLLPDGTTEEWKNIAPERLPDVRPEILDPPSAAAVAHRFALGVHSAEVDPRAALRLRSRESLRDQPLGLHLQVEREFLVHARLRGAERRAKACPESLPPAHTPTSRFEDERHGRGEALPFVDLFAERLAPFFGQRVVARAPIVLGGLPFTLDPAVVLETLQGGVDRALVDVEPPLGELLDAQSDPPAVHRLQRERLQDQEIDAAAERIGFLRMLGGHGPVLEVERSIGRRSLEVKRRTGSGPSRPSFVPDD